MTALPIYPDQITLPGLGYNVKWSPVFFNMPTDTTATGADIDLGLSQYPLHDFELTYEFLRDRPYSPVGSQSMLSSLEFRTLMGFHLQLGGTRGRFLFTNVDDSSVSQQYVGVGDGATTTFSLVRTFGTAQYSGTEPVGVVDTSKAFNVYLNGSTFPVAPSAYSVVTTTPGLQQLVFNSAPPAAQSVAVDMTYWYYCKLGTNNLTFERFMERLWLLNKIQIHSCRPGA